MAHGTIVQLSKSPITEDDYITPDLFYEGYERFADYIGDEITDDKRLREIKGFVTVFKGAFEQDNDSLVYKGIENFTRLWTDEIKSKASEIKDGEYDFLKFYKLKDALENFNIDGFRYCIKDWNDSPDPVGTLVNFCQSELKPGDRVFVGGMVDYHY